MKYEPVENEYGETKEIALHKQHTLTSRLDRIKRLEIGLLIPEDREYVVRAVNAYEEMAKTPGEMGEEKEVRIL